MQRCFHCVKPVLGITGQDRVLDTLFVSPLEKDIADQEAWGECHSSCLESTPWARRWAEAILRNLVSVRGFELLALPGAEVCFDRLFLSTFVHLTSSHRCISFSSWSIDRASFNSEYLIVDEEINWELGEYFDDCRSELSPIFADGSISLGAIVDLFGVESFYSELVKAKGLFLQTQDTERHFQRGYLCGRRRYPLELPESVQRAVVEGFARAKRISI